MPLELATISGQENPKYSRPVLRSKRSAIGYGLAITAAIAPAYTPAKKPRTSAQYPSPAIASPIVTANETSGSTASRRRWRP